MLIRAVRTNNSKGKQVMPHEKTDTRDESEVQVPVAPEETDSGDESEVPEYLTRQLNSLFPKVICLWFCNASFKSGARGDEALRRAIATRPLDRTIDLSVTHKYVSVLGSVIRECNTLKGELPDSGASRQWSDPVGARQLRAEALRRRAPQTLHPELHTSRTLSIE